MKRQYVTRLLDRLRVQAELPDMTFQACVTSRHPCSSRRALSWRWCPSDSGTRASL
jgi:hypothetical protein